MREFFDKSTTRMVFGIISDSIENEIIRKSVISLVEEGNFKRAAEVIGDIVQDWQKKDRAIVDFKDRLRLLL